MREGGVGLAAPRPSRDSVCNCKRALPSLVGKRHNYRVRRSLCGVARLWLALSLLVFSEVLLRVNTALPLVAGGRR